MVTLYDGARTLSANETIASGYDLAGMLREYARTSRPGWWARLVGWIALWIWSR